jgi:hypothetical protein
MHPTSAADALDGNPLGVRVHGFVDDAGRDALAVVGALELIAKAHPGFSFEAPDDWPHPVLPKGAVW